MAEIHRTAIVDEGACLGRNVRIGPFCIVGSSVEIADDVVIDSHVTISGRTRIGPGTHVHSYASIGGPPQDTSYGDEPTSVVIGANCIVREQATVHRGTARGRGETHIGDNCFLMIGAHVAHDCQLADRVVLVNGATLGGHVEIGEHAILSGLSAVQQRCRIGAHAFVGGLTGVATDIIPFASALGERAELGGLNIVGLKRRGFDRPTIHALRAAYQTIFSGEGSRADRLARIADRYGDVTPVMTVVDFIRDGGDRPLCSPRE